MLVVCSVLWSLAGLLIKLLPWNPMVISGARSLIAAMVFFIYMKIRGQKLKFSRPVLFSGILLCLTMLLFVAANKLTTSANAIIIQSTAPIHIVIISAVFLRQKYVKKEYLVIFFTMLGIALFFFDELSPGNMLGNFLALISGITFASMYVFTNRLPDDESALSAMLFGHIAAAAVGLPFALFFPPQITLQTVTVLFVLGVFQLGVPYILYSLAIRKCRPLYGSLLGMLEPLLNPVWVFLMIGELPGPVAATGGVIVLLSVGIWCATNAKNADSGTQ